MQHYQVMWFINIVPDDGVTDLLELQTPEINWFFVSLFLGKHNPEGLGGFFLMNLRMNFLKGKTSRKYLYWCYTRRGFHIKGELVSTLKSQSRTVSIQGPHTAPAPAKRAQRAERHSERFWPTSKFIPCLPRSTQNLKDPNIWGFRHCLQEIS